MLAIFLGFMKAYNCLDRRLLYNIIKEKGINSKIYHWIKYFLSKPLKRELTL